MIDGTYSILYFDVGSGFFPVGNLVSNSFSEDIDTIDSTTRDNAGWKTQTLTNQSYKLDFNGIVSNVASASKINYKTIRDLKRNREIIDWKIQDNQSNIEQGRAQITSLSNEANIDEFVTFSASMQGYGSLSTNYFKFQVTTSNAGTSNSNQFSLPLTSAFTGNISVDWGDATTSNITSYNQAEVTHTYATAGTYTIKILGAITAGWIFNNGGDCLKMGDITIWGKFSCTSPNTFYGCSNMTSIGSDVDFLNQATFLPSYFDNCGLTSLPSTLTLANLVHGWQMFRSNSLTALPSGMLLHNLINGTSMFSGNSLTDLPSGVTLSNLSNGTNLLLNNTINTTRYSQLLIDLENLNSNNNFSFHGGNSQYNTSGQTARNILTASPRNLTITDGGSINQFQFQVTTSNAGTSNNYQFSLPLTSAFTGNISVDWGDSTTSNITSYNQSEVTHTYAATGTYNIKILGAITAGWQFLSTNDCLKMGDIANFGGFSAVVNGDFSGCANMTSIGSDVDFLNQATSLGSYFDNCGLTSLPSTLTLANLQVGNQMFRGNSLTTLPSGMLLHNLTSGISMFWNNSLTSLPSGMTLANLTNGFYMFRNNSLTSLPSGMILANLTDGRYMFTNSSLTALPSGMTLASLILASTMFSGNSFTDLPTGITLSNLSDGYYLFNSSTINTTRYSQLLIDLENLNSNNNFSFHGGNSQYNTSGQTARNILTASPRNLTITDGGLV
jgi:TP901-1 family phage major tail protein